MVALPVIEEIIAQDSPSELAQLVDGVTPDQDETVSRLIEGDRRFVVYPPNAGFDILSDIDAVTDFAYEANIFFSPRFCVPAMPRLDDRQVRLMVMQDGDRMKPHTRFLMPFTVEKPGFAVGPDLVRAWSSPFGPCGVPIMERREAARIVEDLFATLAMQTVQLPKIIAFSDVPVDSPVISLMRSMAMQAGLPVAMTKVVKRPVLDATKDADTYFNDALSGHHRRNYARQWRQLEERGELEYTIARLPDTVRLAMEEFLLLENKGWKGRKRTSLLSDRYRGAFAREAINNLAARDKCRIHALTLDGEVIASLVVFVDAGRAWTWKTAFDEDYSAFSPGTLLMMRVTENLLDDPNVIHADSCALPNHPVMSRLWTETRDMVTLVIGMRPEDDREVRRAAAQIELYASTRTLAKNVRDRLRGLVKKG